MLGSEFSNMLPVRSITYIAMAITLPTPAQLGFGSKFTAWRSNQEQAIIDGLESSKRFIGQVLSLGQGKSLACIAQAVVSKSRAMYLTSTKGLQSQLLDDFSDMGLVDIRGKSNYSCLGERGKSCDEGMLAKCIYRNTCHCTWGSAKSKAAEASLVTTNYTCWTSTNRYGMGFGKFDMLIMDEAHSAEDALAKALRITIHQRDTSELLKFALDPDDAGDMEAWKRWALVARRRAELELQALNDKLDRSSHPSDEQIRKFRVLSGLKRKLADLATCKPGKWVVEPISGELEGFSFDPVEPSDYAEKVLFCNIPRVILTSGTIRPSTITSLGVSLDDFDFFEYPRTINPSRTPLMFIPTVPVDRNIPEWGLRRLVDRVDEIIESRADRRGIIHTGNFKIRDFIIQNSRYAGYMITNYTQEGDVTAEIIKRFKQTKPPTVLVTPSVTTGYDFPDDLCRYQIIAKLPYPDTYSSKVERERQRLDPTRGISIMWQHLAQAFGRPDRSEGDWCETFILDNHVENAMWRHASLAPSWLPVYFRKVMDVPVPTRFD